MKLLEFPYIGGGNTYHDSIFCHDSKAIIDISVKRGSCKGLFILGILRYGATLSINVGISFSPI